MDLCDKSYGFIHLPTLIVFVNPFSPHDSVTTKLLSGKAADENVDDFLKTLPQPELVDFMQRFSSLFHERKHFHDLLITPLGNHLVRLAFKYAVTSTIVFVDRNWRPHDEVEVPLPSAGTKTAGLVERAKQIQQQFLEAFRSARRTLEASATYAQLQFIWTNFGETAALTTHADFAGVPDYSHLLNQFVELGQSLSSTFEEPWFASACHELLLLALGNTEPKAGYASHDAFVTDALGRLQTFPPAEGKARFREALKRGWDVVESNMKVADHDNEAFLGSLEKMAAKAPAINESVINSFHDFCVKSKMARQDVLNNPQDFFSLERYVTQDPIRVGPLIYFYSDDDELSMSEQPLDLKTEDLVAQAEYKISENEVRYSHRLQPSKFEPRVELDKNAWINFAKSAGGAVVLMEDLDWLHPLQTYWLRTVEPLTNVQFTRG